MCALISGFHHVCVKTRDWDRTMSFYKDTLGFVEKITWRAAPQRAVMLNAGDGNYLEVFEDLAYAAAPNGAVIHFALRTSRLDEVAALVPVVVHGEQKVPTHVTIIGTPARASSTRSMHMAGRSRASFSAYSWKRANSKPADTLGLVLQC